MKYIIQNVVLAGSMMLFAVGCNQQPPAVLTTPQIPQNASSGASSSSGSLSAATTQTYTNSTYNFSFVYGNDFTFVTPAYGSLLNQIVQVQMGNSDYPKTNFNDADFTVSQDYAKTQAACLALTGNANANGGFANQQTINGVTFYAKKGSDAAAGNEYASTLYRTYHGTDCIELTETIHTGNIDNYPAGTVTEVDTTPIQSELDHILNSFKFTK
jgi:hypothetical protein